MSRDAAVAEAVSVPDIIRYLVRLAASRWVVTCVLDDALPTRAPVNVVLVTAGTERSPD